MNNMADYAFDVETISGLDIMVDLSAEKGKLLDWVQNHQADISRGLDEKGALLLRGGALTGSRQFGKLLRCIFDDELLPYNHRSTPRTEFRNNIYTATEYRNDQIIVQHNEQAYTNVWPMRIGFACMLPAKEGGETPIADSRKIYQLVPAEIRHEFERKGLTYIRNFSNIDLKWQEVFCTEERTEVEAYCDANHIEYTWFGDNLRTKQHLPAVVKHPHTGETLWFNQAHLFHASNLEASVRDTLIADGGIENLPRNTVFGDGKAINDEVLRNVVDLYEKHQVRFPWQKGDIMLLDNMLYSHGRRPFSGERQVLVGMAKPQTAEAL